MTNARSVYAQARGPASADEQTPGEALKPRRALEVRSGSVGIYGTTIGVRLRHASYEVVEPALRTQTCSP